MMYKFQKSENNKNNFRASCLVLRASRLSTDRQSGAATLISVVFFLIISLITISGFVFVAVSQAQVARDLINSKRAIAAAESGLEEAAYQITNGNSAGASAFTIKYNNADQTVAASTIANGVYTTTANINGVVRKASFERAGFNFSFPYALMAWGDDDDTEGVIELRNNAEVVGGNVWANGDVIGYGSGSNKKNISSLGETLLSKGVSPIFYVNGKMEKLNFTDHTVSCDPNGTPPTYPPYVLQAKQFEKIDVTGTTLPLASSTSGDGTPTNTCGTVGNFIEQAKNPPMTSDDISALVDRAQKSSNGECGSGCLVDGELDINNNSDFNTHVLNGNFKYKKISGSFRLRHNDDGPINLTSDLYITGNFTIDGDGCDKIISDKHRFIIVEGIVKITSDCDLSGEDNEKRIIIISLNSSTQAIELAGSNAVKTGLLYAPNGGVLLRGSTIAHGIYGKFIEMKGGSPQARYQTDYYDQINENLGFTNWKEAE